MERKDRDGVCCQPKHTSLIIDVFCLSCFLSGGGGSGGGSGGAWFPVE